MDKEKPASPITLTASWAAADLKLYSGCYSLKLLSIHDHVASFQVTGWPHLFFIGDLQLARGPASVGLTPGDFNFFKGLLKQNSTGKIEDSRVIFNSPEAIMIIDRRGGEEKSFAPVSCFNENKRELVNVLNYYENSLKQPVLPTPSAVLLDRPGGEDFCRKAIADNFPAIIKALINQNKQELIKYCRNICGMGHGLTPTGDDLIHAAFVVANLSGRKGREFMSSLRPEVEVLSAQTGLFGRHMIEIGRQGLTPEPFLKYLEALSRGFKASEIINDMVSIGSTTGFDLAIGMTVTAKECISYGLKLDK